MSDLISSLSMWRERIARGWRWSVRVAAFLFFVQVLLAVTGWQGRMAQWLGMSGDDGIDGPEVIVVLGGGGIPSASGLMRCYYAAELHHEYPDVPYIVSLPSDGDPEVDSVGRMRDELVMRGVPAEQIRMETRALNTHEQAVNIAGMVEGDWAATRVLLVTSSYHIRRSVLCFRDAGFTAVGSLAAVDTGPEADIGRGGWIRYVVWSNLAAQPAMIRELIAIAWYQMRGWI